MNPYEVLGIDKSATDSEIKKAFRELSKKYHPDVCKEDNADQKFKEINDAYSILSDPQKKANYDNYGSAEGPTSSQASGFNGFSGFDGFGDFKFGGFNPFRNAGYRKRSGESLQYDLTVTLYEACFGAKKPISYSHLVPCDACNGKGGKGETACPTCHGTGVETLTKGMWLETTTCRTCKGTGRTFTEQCLSCHGTGKVEKTETPTVTIPPGCTPGTTLRIRGKGNIGDGGASPGDLLIRINVIPDHDFALNGYDLETVRTINIAQALLGGKREITLLDRDDSGNPKKIRVTIPPGSSAGTRLRVPGKGFSKRDGQRGDLYIVLDLEVPTMLSEQERQIVEDFASKMKMPLDT